MHDRPASTTRHENALLVLGMHRSGTSLLTGTLEELGLHLGEVRVQSPYNRKGNRESLVIQRFHEQLLTNNGASWRKPPDGQCRWDEEMTAAGRKILTGLYRPDQPWGFKDPRSIFALEGWQSLLERPRLVAMVRPRAQVARSLSLRGPVSIPEQHGKALWTRYNRELLRLVERDQVPVLPFPGGQRERTQYFDGLRSLCQRWKLEHPDAATFYDEALIHHREPEAPDDDDGLYESLLAAGKVHTAAARTSVG